MRNFSPWRSLLRAAIAWGISIGTINPAYGWIEEVPQTTNDIIWGGFGWPIGIPYHDIQGNSQIIRLQKLFWNWGVMFWMPQWLPLNEIFLYTWIDPKIIEGFKEEWVTHIYISPHQITDPKLKGKNGEIIAVLMDGFEKYIYHSRNWFYFIWLTGS